jgi:hypothetical protein
MNLTDAFYELKLENAFLRANGDEFQTLFERLMGLAYKADFMACRPWGNRGDRKNDGFLRSERRLFQVYAPNQMSENRAKAKIAEDFNGAKVHWRYHSPTTRKVVTPLNRKPGGLMEQSNASLQRGNQG